MNKIKEVFKNKNFNEQTLYYIENFIDEFDSLFGKYLPRQELIQRIYDNLNENISFEQLPDSRHGNYNRALKKVTIRESLDKEEIKSVIFHEMIHAIMNREDFDGFEKVYAAVDLGQLKVTTAKGITEGFTQYITNMRDKVYFKGQRNYVSYPILTELTGELIEVIGKEEFLYMAYNEPDKLSDLMYKKTSLKEEFIEADDIINNFDIIWKHEATLYRNRENKLLKAIFGKDMYKIEDDKNAGLSCAKKNIIKFFIENILPEKIQSLDEFEKIYRKIQKYNEQLNYGGNFETFNLLFEKLEQIEGTSEEKLLKLPNDIAQEIILKMKIDAFLKKEPQEQLKTISDPEYEDNCDIYESEFEEYYIKEIVLSIFGHNFNISNGKIYDLLNSGLAKIIIDRNYNMKTLAIEQIGFDDGLKRNSWKCI